MSGVSRRQFIGGMGAATVATVAGGVADREHRPRRVPALAPALSKAALAGRRPNILLIVSDQERSGLDLPGGLGLNAHELLMEKGVTFTNYHANTTPCSPSRSNMYFGQHTQHTHMTANIGAPPTFPVLADNLASVGHLLRAQGYYTAYKGKWHLSEMRHDPGLVYGLYPDTRDLLEPFGFSDFNVDGDPHGSTWTGYRYDAQTASSAAQWLGTRAKAMQGRQPWFLAVNFVNPHDVMYVSTGPKQEATRLNKDFLSPLAASPVGGVYDKYWDLPLPPSFYQADVTIKPWAQRSYIEFCNALYGDVDPSDEAAWRAYQSYYFNCIRDVDSHALTVLQTLEKLGLDGETIVVYTADHGEMAGAQKMRQKGPQMYKENIRVPLIIRHPDVSGGVQTPALASCVDLAPTLLGLAGVQTASIAEHYPFLVGVNVSAAVAAPQNRTERDQRGILFNYGVPLYIDPNFTEAIIRTRDSSAPLGALDVGLHTGQFTPSLNNRGLFRGVHDGRYKFARYFEPSQHHEPRDWDTLVKHNDLELYDTQADPDELNNLARAPEKNKELLLDLALKTNRLIESEVGKDNGAEFPGPSSRYTL